MMQKPEKLLKPWDMGTHLTVLSESYQMNTNMTGLKCSQKSFCPCAFDESIFSIERIDNIYIFYVFSGVLIYIERKKGNFGTTRVNYTSLGPNEYYNYLPGNVARANASDFVPLTGSVQFGPGETQKNFTLLIRDDVIPEQDESVFVRLTSVELIQGAQVRRGEDNLENPVFFVNNQDKISQFCIS